MLQNVYFQCTYIPSSDEDWREVEIANAPSCDDAAQWFKCMFDIVDKENDEHLQYAIYL
jgi:hypothetical protein